MLYPYLSGSIADGFELWSRQRTVMRALVHAQRQLRLAARGRTFVPEPNGRRTSFFITLRPHTREVPIL